MERNLSTSTLGSMSTTRSMCQRSEHSSSDCASEKINISGEIGQYLEGSGLNVDSTGLVTWQQDSPAHPRNWKLSKKIFDSAVIIIFGFITALSSNSGTTAADHSSDELHVSKEFAIFAFSTIFLLGQAIGNVILPPSTEAFGRRTSYIFGCAVFTICCIILGATRNIASVIVCRFVSGFASSLPTTVATGSLEDIWDSKARVWAYNTWIAAAILALALAPTVATFLSTSSLGWPWIFWITAISSGVMTAFSIFLSESRPNAVIQGKIKAISKVHRSNSSPTLHCDDHDKQLAFTSFLYETLGRPIRLLFTEPIVLTVTVLNSTVYATIYLLTAALEVVYSESEFGFSERQSSLVSLAIGVGVVFTVLTRVIDNRIAVNRIRRNELLQPEDKLVGFYIAAPCLAVASWWFAWTVPPSVPAASISPWVSIPALVVIGFAANEFEYALSSYLTDSYNTYASSANASLAFFRATLSGCYPLFGTQMFENLGNNVAGSALAAIATGYCFIALLFWKYGKRIREASKVAS